MRWRVSIAVAAVALTLSLTAVLAEEGQWAGHNYAAPEDHAKARDARRQARRAHAQERYRPHVPSSDSHGSEDSSHSTEASASQHSSGQGEPSVPRSPFSWDGQPSWEWDNPRTLYFEPIAGLGNRLRALASAVVMAKEYGVGLKVIWREEEGCGDMCGNPGFNSTWPDLFSEPRLRLADNFPGSNYSVMREMIYLRANDRDEHTPDLQPSQCYIHNPIDYTQMQDMMQNKWQTVEGVSGEILCMRSDRWLTEAGEKEGKFFFRLLKPSPRVAAMIDQFKYDTEWDQNHMVGVHVRRGDLTVYGKDNDHKKITSLIPIESYIETMRAQKKLAAGVKRVRFFLATDDVEAETAIKAAFKPGWVLTYKKTAWSRLDVEAIQQALVDVLLLADCPVLIGTYYSSYSETAKMMGWPYFIQVGHELKKRAIETVIQKEDPEEDEDEFRRRRTHRRMIEATA